MLHARLDFSRCALLVSLFLLPSSFGWTQVDTTSSVSFGDSLTDNESLFLLFGTDPAIYGADPIEAVFDKAAMESDQLTNYAVLGSTSVQVLDQVISYASDRLLGNVPRGTLISMQGGGNDFLTEEVLLALAAVPPGESEFADGIVNEIRGNLMTSLLILRVVDRKASIVLWTVPDVTLTPYVLSFGLDAESQSNVRLHIERLNRGIRRLARSRRIAVLDVASVLTAVTIAPPTILGVSLFPTPAFGFATAIFADPIHPTAVSNAILANELIERLNEGFNDDIPVYSESELSQLLGS